MDSREDLIKSLAGAMGMSGTKKKEDSRFDRTTGTLYCGSHVYSAADISSAKAFCLESSKKMASLNDSSAAFYEIAAEAIALLEKDNITNGGKMVVRDGDKK